MITDASYSEALSRARDIGTSHGKAAGSWVFDGNTSIDTYAETARQLDEGDPEVYDHLPTSDLSGEFADSYSSRDLIVDVLGDNADAETLGDLGELFRAYEDAFDDAVIDEVTRACQYQLGESR